MMTLRYVMATTYTHSVGLDVARFDYSGNARASIAWNE